MRKLALVLASSVLFALPFAVMADEEIDPFLTTTPEGPPEKGISLGLRLGYAFPIGKAGGGADETLSSMFKRSVPIQFDIGWRFNPKIYAGAFFEYGFTSLADAHQEDCKNNANECSARTYRFGLDFVYTFSPNAKFIPWAGLGVGYEMTKSTSSAAGSSIEAVIRGVEFAHLMTGVDYRLSPVFKIGPFVNFTLAQYSQIETPVVPGSDPPVVGPTRTYDVEPKGIHGWLQFGVKIAADL
jgi:hypothetical protein